MKPVSMGLEPLSAGKRTWVETTLASLSIDERIGQTLIPKTDRKPDCVLLSLTLPFSLFLQQAKKKS